MAGELSIEWIREASKLRELAPESRALSLAMRPRLPFATDAWLRLWWQHYRERRLLVQDEFYLHTVRDRSRRLVALAPLVRTERPSVGPLRSRGLAFLGMDKNITEMRGLICAPEDEAAVAQALLAHLNERGEEWDWFAWDGVRRGGEAYRLLSKLDNFEWLREVDGYYLLLPPSWEEFRRTRSRNIKESLRKCYNSLKRDGLGFQFRVVERAPELKLAIERFFELHARRAHAAELRDHADYFAPVPARQLLRGLAEEPESAPRLRAFELYVSGRVVASRLGFLLDDELYLYFSGFDPAFARYSVMTTAVAECIKWAIAQKLRCVNLSTGTDVSKTRWAPQTFLTSNGVLVSPSRRGQLLWRVARAVAKRAPSAGALQPLIDLARRRG